MAIYLVLTQQALQYWFNVGLWLRRHSHKNNVFSTSLTDTVKTSKEDVAYTWNLGCNISDVKTIFSTSRTDRLFYV